MMCSVAHSQAGELVRSPTVLVQLPGINPPSCGAVLQFREGSQGLLPLEFGVLHELESAKLCLAIKNFAMACRHWKRALPSLNHMYPYLSDVRQGVMKLINQYDCDAGGR